MPQLPHHSGPMVDGVGKSRSVQQVSFRAVWPLSIGVACDVFAFDGFQEHEAGQLWCAPGSAKPVFDCCPTLDIKDPAAAVLILRPNPDIARRTVDIFEIFGGEIVLGPAQPHIYDPEASP